MKTIGIAGATGVMGSEIMNILQGELQKDVTVRLFATAGSAGEMYEVVGKEVLIETLSLPGLLDCDVIIFATPPAVGEQYLATLKQKGKRIIELVHRPESTLIAGRLGYGSANHVGIATPAVQIAYPILKALDGLDPISSITATVLHSASTAGKNAIDELWSQTLSVFNQQAMSTETLQHQLAFNVIPQVDVVQDDARTAEERRFIEQSKLLLSSDPKVSITAVRIPMLHGMGITLSITLSHPHSREEIEALLSSTAGVVFENDWTIFPMPLDVSQNTEIHAGRLRVSDATVELWVCGDPLAVTAVCAAHSVLHSMD